MKKYTYQAKNFNEAKNLAMTELMEQEENLYIKEIESSTKLFNKRYCFRNGFNFKYGS